jgi:hypothetical protein
MAKNNNGDSEQGSINKSDKKQKLFIPRKIDERIIEWNNMQPIMNIDGEEVRINQEDEKGMQGYWKDPKGRYGVDEGFYINGKKRVQQSNIEILSLLESISNKLYPISNLTHMSHTLVFHLDGKELLMRRSPRIPKVGENVILPFREIVEGFEFVKKYFLEQAIKINDIIPIENPFSDDEEYFIFEVESVVCFYFDCDWDEDQYEQYYVKLIPKLNPQKKVHKVKKTK